MLTEASLQNFKGISKCDLTDLSRINLLIGKNDSGKSTILEALYHPIAALTNLHDLGESVSHKTNVFSSGRELWYRYDVNSQIEITLGFPEIKLRLRIKHDERRSLTETFFEYLDKQTKLYKQFSAQSYSGFKVLIGDSNAIYNLNLGLVQRPNLEQFSSEAALIDCTLKHEANIIESSLAKLKMRGEDRKFGSLLDNIYGKGSEWEFVPHVDDPGESRLALRENGKLTYFSDFGDGLRFCVGILGKLMTIKNTAIFIEEIESHQHSGSLKQLIRHMVTIARENNLQIFLSTHSKDVWESLSRGVYLDDEEREKQEFRCFVINRNINTGQMIIEKTDDVQKINQALN